MVDADTAIGLTPAHYVLDKYPEGNRAFHRFRDGAYSSCNLYALMTPRAVEGARIFRSGGQFGKKPRRLIGALSRSLGLRAVPVLKPFAEAPIDVDRMQDWQLANRIVREREAP